MIRLADKNRFIQTLVTQTLHFYVSTFLLYCPRLLFRPSYLLLVLSLMEDFNASRLPALLSYLHFFRDLLVIVLSALLQSRM